MSVAPTKPKFKVSAEQIKNAVYSAKSEMEAADKAVAAKFAEMAKQDAANKAKQDADRKIKKDAADEAKKAAKAAADKVKFEEGVKAEKQAAEDAVSMLKNRLGDDFPAFVELYRTGINRFAWLMKDV